MRTPLPRHVVELEDFGLRTAKKFVDFKNEEDYENLSSCEGFVYEEDVEMHEGLGNFDNVELEGFESLSWT